MFNVHYSFSIIISEIKNRAGGGRGEREWIVSVEHYVELRLIETETDFLPSFPSFS